jgi:hypothetical protein
MYQANQSIEFIINIYQTFLLTIISSYSQEESYLFQATKWPYVNNPDATGGKKKKLESSPEGAKCT